MGSQTSYHIAVFDGDGIGREITDPALELLASAMARTDAPALEFERLAAGAQAYLDCGEALPAESVRRASKTDAILLAAMGDPSVRYKDGTELIPQVELRFALDLYAGYRPIRAIPGVSGPLADERVLDTDFVMVRESIEGLFAPDRKGTKTDSEATETLLITRSNSERLFKKTFDLARRRKAAGHSGEVLCVDKANVFGAFAFFRDIFDECAEQADWSQHADHAYVDAMAMFLVNRPWSFDVMVTENMFGDILSDLCAALIGGMGYAPSADIGDKHAVFQPCHGSAPDIAGKGLANPTAMFLSGAMMLEWLAEQHSDNATAQAAIALRLAVDRAFAGGSLKTCELGGDSGTQAVYEAVKAELARLGDNEIADTPPTVTI